MFDMEMLNDALNMPLPLFSTEKEEEDSALAPSIGFPFAATTHSERGPRSGPPRYCSSNVYLSKRKKPPFERNGANSPSFSSSTLLDRLPVRIDSGVAMPHFQRNASGNNLRLFRSTYLFLSRFLIRDGNI